MTTLSSFWAVMCYEVKGEMFWWYNAVMESSMLNALMRYLEKFPNRDNLTEISREHWTYTDPENRRDTTVNFLVFMQHDMPPLVNENHTTIYDNRDKDLLRQAKKQEEEKKSKFKPLPDTINFKF